MAAQLGVTDNLISSSLILATVQSERRCRLYHTLNLVQYWFPPFFYQSTSIGIYTA